MCRGNGFPEEGKRSGLIAPHSLLIDFHTVGGLTGCTIGRGRPARARAGAGEARHTVPASGPEISDDASKERILRLSSYEPTLLFILINLAVALRNRQRNPRTSSVRLVK